MVGQSCDDGSTSRGERQTVGVVLSGGGARGAYEVGALSVLLPELTAAGHNVSVIVGTSVGAVNGAWLAANLHRPVQELVAAHRELWRSLEWEAVLSPLLSPRSLVPLGRYVAGLFGASAPIDSVLDSSPLIKTIAGEIDFTQLARNVETGCVHAAGVVATSAASELSVVFHAGGGAVDADLERGIRYAPADLDAQHVQASAAIPGAFRAARITSPAGAEGWYVDGGTRLNTPIKPVLALGADRVIVIALNSTRARQGGPSRRPDVFQGLGHISQAVLADPMAHDVRTLATINELAAHGHASHHRVVPYILIEPRVRDRIGELASHVFAEHYAGLSRLRTSVGVLGRLLRADASAANGELLSYLFFAPEFSEALLAEGAADAEEWLRAQHDDGLWQRARLENREARAEPGLAAVASEPM